MTTKKISELTELIALSDADAVPVVHTGVTKRISGANLKSYMLTGTVTALNFAATSNGAGTSFKVGDDAWIGDINVGNSIGVRGIQDATQGYIVFGNANSTSYIGRSGTAPITVTGAFAGTANITAAGSFVSTATGSAATNGGQIVLNGATSNRIDFAGVGLGDPNASARSAGTKIVLWPQIDGSGVDYAIGLTSGVLWNSVHDETKSFKWFANTTAVATLTGTGTLTVGNINAVGNIIPLTDNVYTLGSTLHRWKSAYIGPGSIYIQDTANAALNAELTVTNGVLLVNGANQLQVGQLKFVNNTIESTTGSIDIQIGNVNSSANLVLNRNVTIPGTKTLIVGDVDEEGNNITVNGIPYTSQIVASSTGSEFVGQVMLHRHSTSTQPILASALSNSDTTDIDADIGYGQPLFQIAVTAWAGDDYKEFGGIVFSSEDMEGVTIGQGSSPGKILFNVVPDGDTHTNTAMTIRHDASVEFSNGLILNPSQIPSTSKGNPGDRSGMFAVDNNNIYYCVENYSNGNVNIWKKTALTGGTW